MPTMPPRNTKKPPFVQTHINAVMYEDSFDLLSASRDFSEQYMPMAEPRFITTQTGRGFDMPPTRSSPPRSQSSRFSDRALPNPMFAKAPTMKNVLSPRAKLHDEEAAVNYPLTSTKGRNGNLDLTFANMGYAEVPAEMPRSPGPHVHDTRKTRSFKMHKLKEPNLEDEWNDIVEEKKNRYRDCCCCVFSSSILVLITAGIIVASLYFALRPTPPSIRVVNLNVTDFKLLSTDTRDREPWLETGITCLVRITNPNKFAVVEHKAVNLTLNFREQVLGQTSVRGFQQSQKNVTNLLAKVPKTLAKIKDPLDAVNLLREVNEANVRVELRGSATGHYRLLGINVKHLNIPVHCKLNVKPQIEDSDAEIIFSSCYTPA